MKYEARMSKRFAIGGLAAAVTAVLALGACGSTAAHAPPQQALSDSFQAIGSQSGVNLRISLAVTPQQLQQIGKPDGGGSRLTSRAADAIASSTIVVDFNTGNGKAINDNRAAGDRAEQFGLAVQVGATDPVELRYVDQTIYLRADLSALLSDLGQDPSKAASFQQALQSANAVVPGIAALGQGQWVSVPASALESLLKGVVSQLPASSSGSSASTPGISAQMVGELEKAFTSNATYTDVGSQGGRTHYRVSLAVRPFARQVMAALPAALNNIPGASSVGNALNRDISRIPAKQTAVVDVWVSNNKVQEIDIDLNQFGHKFGFAVPLRIEIGPGTAVSAPSAATPLSLSKVPGLLGGLLGGSLNTGASNSST